jgi:hypothetical protein
VQNNSNERFNLVTPDKNMGRAAIESWISLRGRDRAVQDGRPGLSEAQGAGATRDFKPVSLGMTASVHGEAAHAHVDSANVVAKLTGSDPALKDRVRDVHRALGSSRRCRNRRHGDEIYNGAADNASGVAMVMEIARAMKAVQPAPKRSVLFLFVTAEEQGLLGSQYYADFPLYPLTKTLANINIDGINQWGRTKRPDGDWLWRVRSG